MYICMKSCLVNSTFTRVNHAQSKTFNRPIDHRSSSFMAIGYWKSMLNRIGGPASRRYFATAAVTPESQASRLASNGEWAPIAVLGGFLAVALGIGAHTMKQQLVHSPGVNVSKKSRETMLEVEEPDRVLSSSDKFLNKSFLRKVAHIQDHPRTMPDPVRADPYTQPRTAETLKEVGVNPKRRV